MVSLGQPWSSLVPFDVKICCSASLSRTTLSLAWLRELLVCKCSDVDAIEDDHHQREHVEVNALSQLNGPSLDHPRDQGSIWCAIIDKGFLVKLSGSTLQHDVICTSERLQDANLRCSFLIYEVTKSWFLGIHRRY